MSLSKNQEKKEAHTERISSLEEEISREVQEKIQQNVEFIDSLEAIAAMMDQGYCDIALSEVCSMAYLPTRRTPRFNKFCEEPSRCLGDIRELRNSSGQVVRRG